MEFIAAETDKKLIQKQETGINQFLIENNLEKIDKILNFLKSPAPLLLINGFMGTGKSMVVKQSLSLINPDVITLKYNCFETTILDNILLEFFENFRQLTAQNIIAIPKVKTENFTQKINSYFDSIQKPVVIIINSFEQVLNENKQDILNFIFHLSKYGKIKIILISRKFEYSDFDNAGAEYEKVSISALDKPVFEKYLRANDIKQIGPLSDELYKYSRGYFLYTTLAIKSIQYRKVSLTDFLSTYTKSFLSFNDFILREALSLVDPISGHLFRFLTIIRHPVNVKLLQTLNLYNADRIEYFVENLVLNKENSLIYLQDYYKEISENSIAENIAVKIHKSCVELYNTQLPLKPLDRDLLVSRQTMRKEIEYHSLFIPKKPVLPKKVIPGVQFIEQKIEEEIPKVPQTKQEKDDKIKNISFVFDSEENEMAIMNKIANSINRFVDVSDKKTKALEEIKNMPLVELLNLAKKEEQQFNYQKVAMIYQKALTMNTDDDYYTFLPTIYTRLASAFKNMSDWFNAQKYYELAVEFYISTGDTEKINECKYEIANIYYITFKRDMAEKLLNEILSEHISPNLQIKAKLLMVSITGKGIKDALPQSTNGIEKSVLAELYFKYAVNMDEDGNIAEAVKYYKKCIDITPNSYMSPALTNLATIYDENGRSDLAEKYLTDSLTLDEQSKNYNGVYISSMKLAEINSAKSPEKTIQFLNKAKQCAAELNETFYIASSEVALGDFYYNRKDYKNALINYIRAHKLAINNFTRDNIYKIEMRIKEIKLHINTNDYKQVTKDLDYEQ